MLGSLVPTLRALSFKSNLWRGYYNNQTKYTLLSIRVYHIRREKTLIIYTEIFEMTNQLSLFHIIFYQQKN